MKKQLAVVVLSFISSLAFAGIETITYTLPADYSTAKIIPSGYDGYVAIECAGLEAIPEPAGAPQLLTTVVRIDAPKNAKLLKVTYEAEWVTLGEDIKLVPIQPLVVCDEPQEIPFAEPNPALYASYPESPIASFGIQRMAGKAFVPVRVIPFRYTNGKLEAAKKFVVKVEFELPPQLMSNMAFTPAHEVTAKEEYVKTDPNQPDYILIAPKNYFNLWQWYVEERQKDHPEKVMLAKNFAEILEEFPVNTDDDTKSYYARNDAERLHAYIRREAKKGTHYFVLAGSWYDAHGCPKDGYVTNVKKELTVTTPEAQYRTNADWGIPGIYTIPRSDMGSFFNAGQKPCPSDLFYACCDLPEGAKYPWDYGSFDKADSEGDQIYCNEPDDRIDLIPDVVVSRIGFICGMTWRTGSESITMRQLVEGYLDKVRKVESPDFAGRNRFAGAGHTFSSEPGLTHGSTLRDEMEFYAGQDNVWDKRRPSYWMDADYVVSLFLKDWFTRYLPATHTEYVSTTTLPPWEPNWDSAVRDLHKQDWEISTVVSHGSQGGSMSQVYINEYAQTMTGLTKIFFAPFPCLMSFPDWTENQNSSGHHKLSHNMSMIENPTGGAAFTIGNTRSGWGGGIINRDCSVGDGLGDKMGGFFVKAYVRDRKNPGDSWLHMIQTYAKGGLGWSTGRWVLVINQAMGDPMLETHFLSDYTWEGVTTGTDVWDLTTSKWRHVDEEGTEIHGRYEHAANTSITTTGDLTLNVATNAVGTLRLVIDQPANATFKLTGGTVRVATNMVVSAGNVTFGVGGGVGHEGIEFVNSKGNIRFEGDEKFYLAKIKNGGTVTFAGSNGLLDLRNFYWSFDGYSEPIKTSKVNERTIDIEAIAFDGTGTGNTIRSDDPGVLTRYLPTTIKNHHIRLETYNGFEGAKAAEKTLEIVDGGVTIANNPNYGLAEAKCFEALDIPLTLDNSTLEIEHVQTFTLGRNVDAEQEFTIKGTSAITSSYNGRLGLYGTTTFVLVDGAELTISAPLDDRGSAKMVFTGSGTLVVESTASLVGEVEIGEGITVVFKNLSLVNVTSLTIGDNAKVVLPQSTSGSYQITPIVGSELIVGEGVVFYNGSLDKPMEGCIANKNGSVFDPSGVLTWLGGGAGLWNGNTWYASGATKTFTDGSGVLFADEAGGNPVLTHNVAVNGRYVGKFMQFINTEPYTIAGTTDDAMLAFGTMTTGGDVTFNDLELNISGVLDAMNGKVEANYLNAEDVRVYDGATLGAGQMGYAFDKIRFIRIYFLDHLNDDTEKVNDHRVRMEELYFNYLDESGNTHTIRNGDISWKGVSGCWVNGNLNVLFDGDDAHKSACASEKQYSAELVADDTTGLNDMAAGKVYMQINLNHTIPMLSSFGVHSSKRTLPDKVNMTHAYRPTKFRIEASYDGVTYYTIMPDFGNRDIGGDNPSFYGGWVGGNSTAFKCNYKSSHPTTVKLFTGGTLLADGSHDATITAEGGAIVKAVPEAQLVGSTTTTWNFAEEPVLIDTEDLTLSATPQPILGGGNIEFASLYHFKPIDPKASLRYRDGVISVVSGDGMVGPYSRTFNGVESWNENTAGGWHYYGEDADGNRLYLPFEKPWSEYSLEQNVEVVLDLATDSIVTLDTDVVCDTVRAADTNNLCGCTLTIKDDGVHTLEAQTLDFSGFNVGEVIYEPNCGAAHVIAGARTVLLGGGSGLLTVGAGNTAVITKPWLGPVEGEGTVILDPGEGKEWADLGCLNLSAKLTVELANGSLVIPENAVWGISRLAVDEGATIATAPTSSSWVLAGKNVTIDGTLEINADAEGWMTNLNYSKIAGTGTIAYVSDQGAVTALPNIAAASTLKIAIGRGKFDVGTVSVPGITIKDGATFSATSLADTSKIRYIRIYFFAISSGSTVRLSRIRFSKNGQNISWHGATVTASQGTTFTTDSGIGSNDIVNNNDPDNFALNMGWDNGVRINTTTEKMKAGECYITIRGNNAVEMFDTYKFKEGKNSWGGYPTAWRIQVSTDGNEFVTVDEKANVTIPGYDLADYGGTASRIAPLNVEEGGALLAKGEITAKITLAEGAIIKPVAGQTMTLVGDSELILPEEGTVTIDVSDLTVGVGATVNLISGKAFTEADLAKFTVLGNETGYRLVLGDDGSLKLTRTHFAPKIIVK